MQPSVQRVVEAARERGLEIEVREFPEGTHTAEDAARAVGAELGQIVKSLVFVVDGEVVVALVSGSNRLDERALAAAAGSPGTKAKRADADRVKDATGFSIGGVPPFGHRQEIATYVDRDLLAYAEIWAAAGGPREVFAVAPDDLVRACGGLVADLKQ